MTKDGYAQRASELTALTACREQLRQESERADREAAEASSLRDEVDRLTRQRDGWHHFFEAQKQREKELGGKVDELCEEVDRLSRALDPADPDDLRTVADFLEHYTSLVWKESPNERPEWSAADLRCKAEYLEESDALIERVARVIYETDERDKTPKREWASRSDALRGDYLANARALHAAGLLTDGEQQ